MYFFNVRVGIYSVRNVVAQSVPFLKKSVWFQRTNNQKKPRLWKTCTYVAGSMIIYSNMLGTTLSA